jgi:hypothetical protein
MHCIYFDRLFKKLFLMKLTFVNGISSCSYGEEGIILPLILKYNFIYAENISIATARNLYFTAKPY